jgi:hypothetical protein
VIDVDEFWTHDAVKEALVDAYLVCERTAGHWGPKSPKAAFLPIYDEIDIWEQRRAGTNDKGRGARPQITSEQIARSDAALFGGRSIPAWLQMLGHSKERIALELWVWREVGKAYGKPRKSVEVLCALLGEGWSKATFDRRVSRGAYLIAESLNQHGLARY